jgi:hypothetical protein
MSYVKTTDFAIKDVLANNDPDKIVSGEEIDVEFENIEQAIEDLVNGVTVIDEGVY